MTMTSQMVALLGENYLVSLAGRGQVAGRPAEELVAGGTGTAGWPRGSGWTTATKLPLRRETYGGGEQMVSEDVFVSLQLASPAAAAAAAPRTAAVAGGKSLATAQLTRLRTAGWPLPAYLPGQLSLVRATETSGQAGAVVDLAYSDGLSVIIAVRAARPSARAAQRLVAGGPCVVTASMRPGPISAAWPGPPAASSTR